MQGLHIRNVEHSQVKHIHLKYLCLKLLCLLAVPCFTSVVHVSFLRFTSEQLEY